MSNMISLIGSITESFTNNLIVEDRYRMILDGLQVTLLITLFAAVLGTIEEVHRHLALRHPQLPTRHRRRR